MRSVYHLIKRNRLFLQDLTFSNMYHNFRMLTTFMCNSLVQEGKPPPLFHCPHGNELHVDAHRVLALTPSSLYPRCPGEEQQHGGRSRPVPEGVWHRGAQRHDGGDGPGAARAHAAVRGSRRQRLGPGLWQGEYRAGPGAGVRVAGTHVGRRRVDLVMSLMGVWVL